MNDRPGFTMFYEIVTVPFDEGPSEQGPGR